MKTVKLGKTGLEVSRVGIGGIPIVAPSMDEAVRIIQHAIDLGINFIDTAFAYGDSEERFGKAIADRRDQVVVATKTPARDKKTATEHLETSLKRLGTSYIDLWQLHGVNNPEDYEKALSPGGVMEAAQEALKAGKINNIGVSTHTPEIARKVIVSGLFATVQYPFNFVNNDAKDELVSLAKKEDDIPRIYEEFEKADMIIFGIPTYVGRVPATYRAWEERGLGIYGLDKLYQRLEKKTYGFIVIGSHSALDEAMRRFYGNPNMTWILLRSREYGLDPLKKGLIEVLDVRNRLDTFVQTLTRLSTQKNQ